jgi:RimJ/RimL family protein N-acetyltransferase
MRSTRSTAPTIETDRLVLRAHRPDDFNGLLAMYKSERSRHIGGPMDAGKVWFGFTSDVGSWVLYGTGAWAVDRRSDGTTVGQLSLNQPVQCPELELGWIMFDGFEGHGYAKEAAEAVRRYAFEDLGVDTIVSYIDEANTRSIALAERLGATLDADAATPGDAPSLVYRHPNHAAGSVDSTT